MGGIRKLAMAVILQALEDLQFPERCQKGGSAKVAAVADTLQSAKEFCLITPAGIDLSFWCTLADIDPEFIQRAGDRINAGILNIDKVKRMIMKVAPKAPEAEDEAFD
jgi:hypothetical protein